MARQYIFGDEAGNLDFKVGHGASNYFIVCSTIMPDCEVGEDLLRLRRDLAWDGIALESTFHATEDKQLVRDEVYRLLSGVDFRIDATIFEKRKTQPRISKNKEYFFKLCWYTHFKHVVPQVIGTKDQFLAVIASFGTKKRRKIIRVGLEDVMAQTSPSTDWEVAFWPAESDPCLQVADYCTWAIQRKWERGDDRSYSLIKGKIATEYDYFQWGSKYYY